MLSGVFPGFILCIIGYARFKNKHDNTNTKKGAPTWENIPDHDESFNKVAYEKFKILGMSGLATFDETKKRYLELCKKYHPDANQGRHSPRFIEINEAYDYLKNFYFYQI